MLLDKKGLILDYKKQDNDDDIDYLEPLIKDTFRSPGGFATLSFKRDKEDNIIGFNVDTGRLRNLKFLKVK